MGQVKIKQVKSEAKLPILSHDWSGTSDMCRQCLAGRHIHPQTKAQLETKRQRILEINRDFYKLSDLLNLITKQFEAIACNNNCDKVVEQDDHGITWSYCYDHDRKYIIDAPEADYVKD